jgi:AraC-like DNA-binding protein
MRLGITGDSYLYFLIREQQIQNIFSPIFNVFNDRGAIHLYDSGGNLLYSRGDVFLPKEIKLGLTGDDGLLPDGFLGPGLIGAYSRSPYGLIFVSAWETDTVLNHVRNLRNLTVVLNIAAAALSLGYALFLARRDFRRVAEAFSLLEENPNLPSYQGGNILSYLNLSVSRLISANAMLRQNTDSYRETLRDAFLERFLSDGWENREEALAAAEHADIALGERRFCVVFLCDSTAAAPGKYPDHSSILESLKGTDVLVHRRNPSRLGMFFLLKEEHWADFREYLEELLQNPIPGGTVFHLVGSGLEDDFFMLREEYKLCKEYALVHDDWKNAGIQWIDKLPPPKRRIFVFPPETEQKLINQLQNADFEGARISIQAVSKANLQEGLLGESMLAIFYATLQGCFLRALEGSLMELYRDAILNLDFYLPPKELEEDFIDLTCDICASVAVEYSKKNAIIKKEELTAYVEAHFGEEQLSLRLAARHFGFSETYFSQMFKDITGENFSTFTELTRLNHAQTFLKEYLKIEEVAYRCGYKSPHTFRRAYKRYFGINPARERR